MKGGVSLGRRSGPLEKAGPPKVKALAGFLLYGSRTLGPGKATRTRLESNRVEKEKVRLGLRILYYYYDSKIFFLGSSFCRWYWVGIPSYRW